MFCLICNLLSAVTPLWAVPAHPGTRKVQQPDGTYVTIRLVGDEWCHFNTTADGPQPTGDSAADVFPGTGDNPVRQLLNSTLPANLLTWSGQPNEFGLTNIEMSDGVITFDVSPTAEELYYPDGTRWGQVWIFFGSGMPNIDSTYHVINSNVIFREYVVEGTASIPLSKTESVECQVVYSYGYDFNNQLVDRQESCFFRQLGDRIIQYNKSNSPYYVGELVYDFRPWCMGETVIQWNRSIALNEESLERRRLLDGNDYDYIPQISCFRTIGIVLNGILPVKGFPRVPSKPVVTYFIRNNVLIYQNNNLIWPEGYVTEIYQPYNDFGGVSRPVYSLQGVVVGDSRNLDALPRGIYILNGKKIFIGR